MSDITVSVAVGALAFPVLATFGIDPQGMVCGLAGCVMVQTLLPSDKAVNHGIKQIFAITVGSMIFASLITPVVSPWAIDYLKDYALIPPTAVRSLCGALAGAFAQSLVGSIKLILIPAVVDRLKNVISGSERKAEK